ncbi:MAG: anti-sigma F factor [Ruminococcaceae bacterium]|nr:anti-sigma F factor [Oscillospiraceae bacterium]MBR3596909.1 anti-sigma F factor [Clostridia bacterium]
MKAINDFKMNIMSKSANEGFIRAVTAAFCALIDPTVEEISDIKTAVSEAVTNAVVHAYKEKQGRIYIDAAIYPDNTVKIRIKDKGCGIEDVKKAMEPLYTTSGDERSGLGFSVMESFCDKLKVSSTPGKGTVVTLTKKITGKCE